MSKKGITLLAAVIVLSCGCGKKEEAVTVSNDYTPSIETSVSEVTENSDVEETTTEEYDHNLVRDRWADKGSFRMYTSDDEYYEFYFDYSVPEIVDDTEDAKEINYFIECLFGDMHETMQKASKEGKITAEEFDDTRWFQTNYDCYWNDSIVSIVIYSTGYYDSNTKYNVYNYDFATGKQVINEDLFELKGITGEKFTDDLRRSAAYLLDLEMQAFFESEMPLIGGETWYADVMDESVQHMYADYLQARAKTIYSDNIDEFVPIYMDDKGELQAVTHIYNMGMYGEVTKVLQPRGWVNNGVMASSGVILDVISKNDGIYLTIYKSDWSEALYETYPNFEFSKEYKINGLYKNYIDARITWVGNGNQPYILLLSDDGMVSYVDVWAGIVSDYFCAVEPLWGLTNIKSFGEDSEYRVVGVNKDGIQVDVDDALYMILNCKYVDFEKNILNLGNVTRYSATVNHKESGQDTEYEELIGFTDDKYHMFVRESYKTDNYEGGSQVGYITFNGMNENGMVFYFSLVGEEGEVRGAMAINVYGFWDEGFGDFVERADMTWLGGFDIFESSGSRIMLKSSVG